MAQSALNDAVFRLPDQFFTDDDMLFDKENAPVNCKSSGAGGLETIAMAAAVAESLKPSSVTVSFPMEFPYEFDSALSSPVDSVVCSIETETENSVSSDEEDFLAGLTRRLTHSTQKLAVPGVTRDKLEKSWVMSGSPESTLSGIGSWSMSSSDSPNGSSLVSSPPATPFSCQNDTWDLISAAAGQVARLKMSNEALNKHNNINTHGRGLIAPPKTTNSVHVIINPNFGGFYPTATATATTPTPTQSVNQQYQQYVKQEQILRGRQQLVRPTWVAPEPPPPHQQQKPHPVQQIPNKLVRNAVGYHENTRCGGGAGGGGGGRPLGLSQSAWPPLQAHPVQQQHTSNTSTNMRAVFLGGSGGGGGGGGVKRECAGTGVFLPRRYGNNNNNVNNFNNNPHDSRKKLGCSTVLLPAKVVQALNLNFEDIHSHVHGHVQAQQRFNGTGFGPNYDALMARRNALLMLQKRSLRADPAINHHHHEQLHLPQDWTY
ncbi:hypothetical protein Dsin_002873 [Dipteronia sinensis]|uniref:Uncharacterized protein n=1 Tax=Dipteronia sinensis TaxID=43782 RepID=A0AAE0EKE3_9ROSI|nr:hypothetical protein Dsin_002873 [Dipteronia sinensis]